MQTKNIEAVSYVKISLPERKVSLDEKTLKILRDEVALKTQGDAAEFDEDSNTTALMAAFDIAHNVSPEVVLRTENRGLFLIFEHRSTSVLRSDNISAEFANEKAEENNNDESLAGIVEINIEKIWDREADEENYINRVKKSLEEIRKEIKPSEVVILVGEKPAILFLIAQHMLYGIAGEIWHQSNEKDEAIKIR